ncbi:MAG TPA: hypothetical protein VG477_08455, partial [Thermoanaerobaculia bacterium]|nr:hypothetical protein [Thermoanaerobaculia bacterium]
MLRDRGVTLPAVLLAMLLPGAANARIELISRVPPRLAPDTATGGTQERPALSDDGRYAAFLSAAPHLIPGQIDPDPSVDIFLHDRVAGTTRLVTHAAGSPVTAADREVELQSPALSADGRFVAFTSPARDLVPGLGDGATYNVYLWDRETGEATLVSRRAGAGEAADGDSFSPSLSAGGGVLAFVSTATELVPGTAVEGQEQNVYLYERATGTVTLVSRSAASASRSGNNPSFAPAVSADGRFVAYLSGAPDLIPGQSDSNLSLDVFLYDRLTGVTTLVSRAASSALTTSNGGSQLPILSGFSLPPSLSGDGRYVVFSSFGTDLVPGVPDTNDRPDVFLFDRLQGTVAFVSLSGSPPHVADGGYEPRISRDGGTVVYFLDDLARHATGSQIVAYDVATGSRGLVTRAPESPFTFGNRGANSVSLSADGRTVAFT